ncbi:MAG: proline racemase family protein [candidate division KSB1 bacterium]|nr:proline racemase family protein [candidate division KSB1 bacterium]MDZ7301209.1 proline racemase family protein [candidate division KSB1 bacterium]MDZ7310567.1 proline racemase family protein [candidate division KSB1 bacterium]
MQQPHTQVLHPLRSWTPPRDWLKITTIDAHTEGEPLRVMVDGYPELPGDTILARRRYAKEHYDHLRTALMWEPRGHREMYGCIITPPVSPEADFGVLFLHNEGYSTMCGHGIIGIATVAVQTGMKKPVEPETVIRIDSPAGLITAHARVKNGKVQSVYFHNVPSFVVGLDEMVAVPGIGTIHYDLAFGGAFYAYVQADQLGFKCTPEETPQLVEKGMAIKRAVMKSREIVHPFEDDLSFLYGTIFIAPPIGQGAHSRNVCIFAEGEVDRSPTGTGVSGRLAIHFARKEITVGQPLVIESIIASKFTGRVVQTTRFGPYEAIIPEVEGTAFITGRNEFLIDPDDPMKNGFII